MGIIIIWMIIIKTINVIMIYESDFILSNFLIELLKIIVMPITTWLIATKITTKMTYNISQKNIEIQNLNRIDESSGWRKELMNVASSETLTKSDIYRIRASLHYKSKDPSLKYNSFKSARDKIKDENPFDVMSAIIIDYCDYLTDDAEEFMKVNNQKKLRIYARYLLKNHWDYFASYQKEDGYKAQQKEVGLQTLEMIEEIDKLDK